MSHIILGLVLFIGTHLFTGFARGPREALIGKVGELPYKSLYAALSLVGIVLIVIGWRSSPPTSMLYTPPTWGYWSAYILVPVSFALVNSAYLPAGRIASAAGHPMILGTILFSLGHLLANGDSRSVTVFGAFFAYGVLARLAYKLRGDTGPKGTSLVGDGAALVSALIGSALFVHLLHPYFAGVSLRIPFH